MTEAQLLQHLRDNPFVLAPMAGITDRSFRSFMREQNCGIVITELVSATGLRFSSEKTRRLMEFDEVQHPIGIQLFGEDLESLAFAARAVEEMGADFVDLNFGCPVPKVVKKGAGAALLKDLVQLRQVLRTVKAAVSIPVTIKVRTGWDEQSRNANQVCRVAFDEGITWMAIHGRTRAQGYSGQADWDYIQQVKSESPIPILGNGDIVTANLAVRRLRESGCDGVMIGRGCLKNPWIFSQALDLWRSREAKVSATTSFVSVFSRLGHYLEQNCDEKIMSLQIKKFAAWYSSGYPESANFRRIIFQSRSLEELKDLVQKYFSDLSPNIQADTSGEAFLMGGHG